MWQSLRSRRSLLTCGSPNTNTSWTLWAAPEKTMDGGECTEPEIGQMEYVGLRTMQ